jgi:ABC-type sugar transport system permease subunit
MLSSNHNKLVGGILFLLPITLIMCVFFILPVFLSLRISFSDWDGISSNIRFIGFQNYIDLIQTDGIQYSIINTITLFTLGTLLINLISLSISLVLDNKGFINRNIHKTLFFIPTILSAIVVALLWKSIYMYDGGMINEVLKSIGLSFLANDWLGMPWIVMVSLTIGYVWYQIGTTMVIYLAGLQSIPSELYESCQIDGASKWQQTKHITLPMLAPSITVNIIFVSITALKTFDFPFALTGGGPGHFSEVISLRIFYYAFKSTAYGMGTALSVVLTIFILAVSLLQVGILRKREEIY